MKKKRFRAAAAQTLARLGDIEHNIEVATQLVNESLRQGAELVVLPECMDTGYLFDSAEHCRALAETVPDGRFVSAMAALARRHGIFIASGITEWDPSRWRIFNSGIMLDRKGEVAIHYHKQFLATHDQNWFAFGERGCPVVDTDLGRIGLLICFDGRIPEIARSLALQGAEIIVDMANFFAMDQADMWGPARSYENGVWLVAATKAGYERSIYYPGGSMIVDPKGRVVAKMPYDRHGVIVADVFPELAHDKSIYAGNDKFADRRPATYGILVENYQDTPVAGTAHEPIVPARAASKVAAVQIHVADGVGPDDVFAMLDHTAKLGAKVLTLPEYALIGAWAPDAAEAARAADLAPTHIATAAAIAKRHGCVIALPTVVREAGHLFPATIVLGPDGAEIGRYRKTHLTAEERAWAQAGDAYPVFETPLRPDRDHERLRRAVPGDVALPGRRRGRYRAVARRHARAVRARIDRGAARRRQPHRARTRQPSRQSLSRRQHGGAADRISPVGHQPGGAALAGHGRGHADVHRSRGLPPEADDPQGRHVRQPSDPDLCRIGRIVAAGGGGGMTRARPRSRPGPRELI
jgi:predicted amidohydrolase